MKKWLFLSVLCLLSCNEEYFHVNNGVLDTPLVISEEAEELGIDLIAFYPFNGDIIDESVNELYTNVYEAELDLDRHGQLNSSLKFDTYDNPNWGERDDIVIAQYDSVLNTNSFTLFGWVNPQIKPTPYTDRPSTILSRWNGNDDSEVFRFQILDDGQLFLQLSNSNPNIEDIGFRSEYIINYDEWSHVAVSLGGGFVKFYINNTLIKLIPTDFEVDSGDSHLTIGELWAGNGYWYHFNGNLDDVGMANGTLMDCQLNKLYNR